MADLYKVSFESSVNSEGIETKTSIGFSNSGFESSVNSEGIETDAPYTADKL